MDNSTILFPFTEYWSFYLGFTAFVILLLAVDLGLFHRKVHRIGFKEALGWSAVWISLALAFNALLYYYAESKFGLPNNQADSAVARRVALEFLVGFVVEKSLSIDNLFVFVAVFSFFGVAEQYQHRVLFYGIIGALIFRAIFIALGSVLMQYHGVVIFFGLLLILTGIKMFFAPRKPIDPSQNLIIRFLQRFIPITNSIEDQRFFIKRNGVRYGTPLLLALVFIEISDIIFAIDSVPAIFALTREPLIVYTSNVFAILGLRSLYFLLAGLYSRFHLLKYGLGIVLIFVGLKMVWLNDLFGGKFPISWSLGIIFGVIGTSAIISFLRPAPNSASVG